MNLAFGLYKAGEVLLLPQVGNEKPGFNNGSAFNVIKESVFEALQKKIFS